MRDRIKWKTRQKKDGNHYDESPRPNIYNVSFRFDIPDHLLPYAMWQEVYYQIAGGVDLAAVLGIIAGHLIGYENLFCSQQTDDDLRRGMYKSVEKYDFEKIYADLDAWSRKKTIVVYPLRNDARGLEVKTKPRSQRGCEDRTKYDFNWALGCGPVHAIAPYGAILVDTEMSPHAKGYQTAQQAEMFANAHSLYLSILGAKGSQLGGTPQEQMVNAAIEAGLHLGILVRMKP